jgi:prophage DNA circulation protein
MIAGTLEIQLLANMARLQKDMDDAKRAVGGAMSDIERHVGAAKAALGGLAAGLLGGLSVAGLVNVAEKAIDAADAMNDLSQRVGISVKDLAKYELASKQSGTSMESLAKGIKGLAGNLMEHGDALKKAGLTATDADGAIRQLAAVFAAMPDGMEKTTLAVKLFGKSGMDLIPMLNMGADGLEKAAEKSAKYASQMAAMAPMADAYNDNMAELAMHNKVASMSMLNELLPALVAITGAMADAAKNGGFLKGVMAGLDEFGNRAFDWSGNNARKEIRTLTKDLEDLQVQQSRITIDIFGAKGSIQTQIEEKTKALEAARKAYYGFTDGSAGGGRGSVNPPNVKPTADAMADYKALMDALKEKAANI